MLHCMKTKKARRDSLPGLLREIPRWGCALSSEDSAAVMRMSRTMRIEARWEATLH